MGKDIRIKGALANHNATQTLATDVQPLDILQIIGHDLQVAWEPIMRISQAWGNVVFHVAGSASNPNGYTYSVPSNSFVWIA